MKSIGRFISKHILTILLVVFALACASLAAYFTNMDGLKETFGGIAFAAVASSLFTGALITFAERVGWLSNYRRELKGMEDRIDMLPMALNERLFFGFEHIIREFREEDFVIDHEGGEICWLNTYFRYWKQKPQIILDAIERGNRVRLLFLDPDSPHLEERAYYSYNGAGDDGFDEHLQAYRSRLDNSYRECRTLVRQFQERFPELPSDTLQIRFYRDSAQLPLIILAAQNPDASSEVKFVPSRAASGFYLDKYSSELPYITWFRRDNAEGRIVANNIYEYFDKKWRNTSTRSLQDLIDADTTVPITAF